MPDKQQQTSRAFLYGVIAMAGTLLLALAGISYWVAHSYFVRPQAAVALPEPKESRPLTLQIVNQRSEPIANATAQSNRVYHADALGKILLHPTNGPRDGVIVSANGYMATTRPFYAGDAGAVATVALSPSRALRGRVLDLSGSPVAGATVAWIGAGGEAYLENGEIGANSTRPEQFQKTASGGDGGFVLNQLSEKCLLVAYSNDGYALLNQDDLAKSTDVRLKPWGRIEGRLFAGGKPVPSQEVECFLSNAYQEPLKPVLSFQCNLNTDADGRFVFSRVCPAEVDVAKVFESKCSIRRLTQLQTISVASGQTATVTLGRTGRQVIGRLAMPQALMDRTDVYFGGIAWGVPSTTQPTTQYANGGWGCRLEVSPDGSYVINDVIPGNYMIHPQFNSSTGITPKVSGTEDFTMPPIPGGYSDEPLKIPDLVVNFNGG